MTLLGSWANGTNVCSGNDGDGATEGSAWEGVTCDAGGAVVELDLRGYGLQGPLPDSLGRITTLQSM